MTPLPPTHLHFEPRVHEDSGEWWFRVAISTSQIRVEDLPALRTAYKDTALRAVNARMDLWGNYNLIKYVNGPDGYIWATFGKAKTEDQAATPYKIESGSKHYDWPTILHAVAFAADNEFPVNEKRPGNRTVAVPRLRARPIVTESAFALCRTETRYYLGTQPFNIPTHPQPVAGRVDWVTNDGAESLVCLHTDMDLPARGESWNVTEIAGDIEVVGNPMPFRHFPATPFVDWQPFTIADNQQETESGHWERRTTIIYPPTFAEPSTL